MDKTADFSLYYCYVFLLDISHLLTDPGYLKAEIN